KKEIRLKGGQECQIEVEREEGDLDEDKYYQIIPSKALSGISALRIPPAIAKEDIAYILISNYSNRSIKIKKGALLAYIDNTNNDNLCYVDINEDNNEEEIIGDKIYIPEPSIENKTISTEDIKNNLEVNNSFKK